MENENKHCEKCRSGYTQSPLKDLCENCPCHIKEGTWFASNATKEVCVDKGYQLAKKALRSAITSKYLTK
jgi:hypothetical protein